MTETKTDPSKGAKAKSAAETPRKRAPAPYPTAPQGRTPSSLPTEKGTPKQGVKKPGYTICPEIGDGSFGPFYGWVESALLPLLGKEVQTTDTLRERVDALPQKSKHPRWDGVWGDKAPQRTAYKNQAERNYLVRVVLNAAAGADPPKCRASRRSGVVGKKRYNGYTSI